jgi:hypothetical protein
LNYNHFYKSSRWIKRKDVHPWSLSVKTKVLAQWDFVEAAWQALYNRHKNESRWRNTQGMKDQWKCHLMTIGHLKTWNFEPSRPNVGLKRTIRAKCNPI